MSGADDYRPVAHFSPARHWMNDPNGLLHSQGRYHLFFQHNPQGAQWGNMSWGHASSVDLISWTEHPVAIACTADEEVWSGSAVLDTHNTSGFGTPDSPPMVAVYTSAYRAGSVPEGLQAQSLAWSTDGGATWSRHADNPVLVRGSGDFRDPKVFWYEPTQSWRMVVALSSEHRVAIYSSPDLRDWTHLSDFGGHGARSGVWECPDLFPLAVDGDPSRVRWVLLVSLTPGVEPGASGTQYFVGDFDGTTFHPLEDRLETGEGRVRWLDHGRDNYAGVTFNDEPDGRRILVGWLGNWQYAAATPTSPWCGQMTAARELTLVSGPDGPRLAQTLVGLDMLTKGRHSRAVRAGERAALPAGGTAYLEVQVDLGLAGEAGIELRGDDGAVTSVLVLADPPRLVVDRTRSGVEVHDLFPSVEIAPLDTTATTVQVLLDRSSVEVLAQGRTCCITDLVFPRRGYTSVTLVSHGSSPRLLSAQVTAIGP